MATTPPRSRALVALLTVLILAFLTGCRSTAGDDGSSAAAANPATTAAATTNDTTKLCGTPPCMRFLSRGHTSELEDTFTHHPIASAIAVHVVGSLLCGGILCILGEGTGLVYIEHETKIAVAANECLKMDILPSGAEWKIVSVKPSNEAPYCTD